VINQAHLFENRPANFLKITRNYSKA